MIPIQTNKPLFFDKMGEPLEGGRIYVGQPGTDPRTNLKTVTLRDSGGVEFVAAQPLRTVAGRIAYNGKPIVALVSGDYSLLVIDSDGTEVDYSQEVSGEVGGSAVDLSQVARVGLTLNDVKSFDVSVGQTVRSVGRISATDDLGADWIAVSSTGAPSDDVNLISFSNGLQGVRLNSHAYRKDVIQAGTFYLNTPVAVVSTTDANSYRGTWTTIDVSSQVPDEASSVILRVRADAEYSSAVADSISLEAAVKKTGTLTTVPQGSIGRSSQETSSASQIGVRLASECSVPVDPGAPSVFDFWLGVNDPFASSLNTNPNLRIYVSGYTINLQDIAG